MEKEIIKTVCPYCLHQMEFVIANNKASKKCKLCKIQVHLSCDDHKIRYVGISKEEIDKEFFLDKIEYYLKTSWLGYQNKDARCLPVKIFANEIFNEKKFNLNWIKKNATVYQMQELINKTEDYYSSHGLLDIVVGRKKFHKRKYAILDSNGNIIK